MSEGALNGDLGLGKVTPHHILTIKQSNYSNKSSSAKRDYISTHPGRKTVKHMWAGPWENVSYANNKGADQHAHPRSLISAFVVRWLDSIISLDSIAEISRFYLAFVAAQTSWCLAWSQTPEDTFCRVVVHVLIASKAVGNTELIFITTSFRFTWATTRQNVSSGVSDQVWLKLACSATEAS